MDLLKEVQGNLALKLPGELVAKLIEHYVDIKSHFLLLKHENTELNASKFSEVIFRILELVLTGTFTPLGTQVHQITAKCRQFETLPAANRDESLRIHIPRTLILLIDIRNKRGVGHVSGIHNPNLADSVLVTKCADWVMAELLRLFNNLSLDKAQEIVDALVSIDLPIVAKIGEIKRVLRTDFTYTEQVLVLLYEEFPKLIIDKDLFIFVEHSNFSMFKRDVLTASHSKRRLEYAKNGQCIILPPGQRIVEDLLSKKNKK